MSDTSVLKRLIDSDLWKWYHLLTAVSTPEKATMAFHEWCSFSAQYYTTLIRFRDDGILTVTNDDAVKGKDKGDRIVSLTTDGRTLLNEVKRELAIPDDAPDPDLWTPHKPKTWPFHFAKLKEPAEFRTWHGHGADPEFTYRTVPIDTTVKIVMVSRFGDVGITDNLRATNGYLARVSLDILEPVYEDLTPK